MSEVKVIIETIGLANDHGLARHCLQPVNQSINVFVWYMVQHRAGEYHIKRSNWKMPFIPTDHAIHSGQMRLNAVQY
jgi:hypothetical protein